MPPSPSLCWKKEARAAGMVLAVPPSASQSKAANSSSLPALLGSALPHFPLHLSAWSIEGIAAWYIYPHVLVKQVATLYIYPLVASSAPKLSTHRVFSRTILLKVFKSVATLSKSGGFRMLSHCVVRNDRNVPRGLSSHQQWCGRGVSQYQPLWLSGSSHWAGMCPSPYPQGTDPSPPIAFPGPSDDRAQ